MKKLNLYRNVARRSVEFYFFEKTQHGIYEAQPIVLTKVDEIDLVRELEPTFHMDIEDAQGFVDELWRDGFRPSFLTDGELTSQSKHLEDMRKIAFMFLDKLP